jgi:formylglycine-generating enzyme required for sulfatase activity
VHSYYAEEVHERMQFLEAEAERQEEEQARLKAEAERLARLEEKDRRTGTVRVAVGTGAGRDEVRRIKPGSGESFKEIDIGPEMVVVPAGEFLMGLIKGRSFSFWD